MKKGKKDSNKKIIIQSTTILILFALILVIGGYIFLKVKYGYEPKDLLLDIVGNLIGVLAAFVLFDILYNTLTQEAISKETSQHITKTLMGDPETMDAFSDDDKKQFMRSTLRSIVKDEMVVDMLMNNVNNYVDGINVLRIRNSFDYNITAATSLSDSCRLLPGHDNYFYVQEVLNYEIKCVAKEHSKLRSKTVMFGFAFDKFSLDKGLLERGNNDFDDCIFNEALDITKEDIAFFRNLSNSREELKKVFQEMFTPTLKIDNGYGELTDVEVRNTGIIVKYNVEYDTSLLDHTVRIIFHMPKKWGTLFEITLVDPTRSPRIIFDFDPDNMEVTMYSYLNKGDESNGGAYEERNGIYDISINDEWIYPKSGIVFMVNKKKK